MAIVARGGRAVAPARLRADPVSHGSAGVPGVEGRADRTMDREMPAMRGMPWGVALFLLYGLVILVGVGLSLGFVVDQAQEVPLTPLGLVVMALLAYTIFTITVVLQRKAAARGLALGLTTLALPAIPLALVSGQVIVGLFVAALAALLFVGLRAPAAVAWLDQP
jgi:hypothetical protein